MEPYTSLFEKNSLQTLKRETVFPFKKRLNQQLLIRFIFVLFSGGVTCIRSIENRRDLASESELKNDHFTALMT